MRLSFRHPRASEIFDADVAPETTGQEVLDGLVGARFLEPPSADRPYTLAHARTSRQLLPTTTVSQVGAVEGDQIAVGQDGKGASPTGEASPWRR